MKILGIDQSYTCSGLVILDNGKLDHYEAFKTDSIKKGDLLPTIERTYKVANHIVGVVVKHNPDVIGIEGLAYSSKGNATRDLAGLYFLIIVELLIKLEYDVEIVAPTAVKHFACGKPEKGTKIDKGAMINALPDETRKKFESLGVKKTTGLSDIADAYWIAKLVEDMRNNKK